LELQSRPHGVSLDPGKWKMGLCLSHQGTITHAMPVHVVGPWSVELAAKSVFAVVEDALGFVPLNWTIEHPRVYPGQGRVASAENVEELEDLAKGLKGYLKPLGAKVVLARPATWKGQVPKEVHHRRVMRELSQAEQLLVEAWEDHPAHLDVLDAVGIELWALGRVGRGGVRR